MGIERWDLSFMSSAGTEPRWVSIAQASRLLEISETAVRKRIRAGALQARGARGATEVLITAPPTSQPSSQPVESKQAEVPRLEAIHLASQVGELRARLADALLERDRWHALAAEALAEARAAEAAREALERELRLLLRRH